MRFEATIFNRRMLSKQTVWSNDLKALVSKLKDDIKDKSCRVDIYDYENGGHCMKNSMIGVAP